MNGPVFKQQLQGKILPSLDRPSCLVMNNASSYHNVVSVSQEDKLPTSSSTKREIKEWLQTKNIHVNDTSLKPELFIIHSKAAEEAQNLWNWQDNTSVWTHKPTTSTLPLSLESDQTCLGQCKTPSSWGKHHFKLSDVKGLTLSAATEGSRKRLFCQMRGLCFKTRGWWLEI